MARMKIDEEMARTIVEHHIGKKPKDIIKLEGGLSNFIYEVPVKDSIYIVRICDVPGKINFYLKEQWAVNESRKKGIPTPEILEVGNEVVPFPYMIVKKIEGRSATEAQDRMPIIKEMGKIAKKIHGIPTKGFGSVFNWSNNMLSKHVTWKKYLEKEFNIEERLEILSKAKVISRNELSLLKVSSKAYGNIRQKPCLHHGDLRLKNILINDKNEIEVLIDWENAMSQPGPYWDISIALQGLNIDEQQSFIEGYGMTMSEYAKMAGYIKFINILNYAPSVDRAMKEKNKKLLDAYKTRLEGAFDLYSL